MSGFKEHAPHEHAPLFPWAHNILTLFEGSQTQNKKYNLTIIQWHKAKEDTAMWKLNTESATTKDFFHHTCNVKEKQLFP